MLWPLGVKTAFACAGGVVSVSEPKYVPGIDGRLGRNTGSRLATITSFGLDSDRPPSASQDLPPSSDSLAVCCPRTVPRVAEAARIGLGTTRQQLTATTRTACANARPARIHALRGDNPRQRMCHTAVQRAARG